MEEQGKWNAASIRVAADIARLPEVLSLLCDAMEQAGSGSKASMAVEVIAEELFTNIASYAYPEQGGDVEVSYEITREPPEIRVFFKDRGIPYNVLEHEDPDVTAPLEERTIGGYGIYMAKKMMDEVTYEYRDGCNVVMIRKNLAD